MPMGHPCSALPWQTGRRIDGWYSYRWIDRWMSRRSHLVKDFYGGTICHTSHTSRNPGFSGQDSIYSTNTSHIPLLFTLSLSQPRRHTVTQEERVRTLRERNQHRPASLQQPRHGRSIFLVNRFDTVFVDCTSHPISALVCTLGTIINQQWGTFDPSICIFFTQEERSFFVSTRQNPRSQDQQSLFPEGLKQGVVFIVSVML